MMHAQGCHVARRPASACQPQLWGGKRCNKPPALQDQTHYHLILAADCCACLPAGLNLCLHGCFWWRAASLLCHAAALATSKHHACRGTHMCRGRNCVSYEHYLPVLLAAQRQEASCACSVGSLDGATYTEWTPGHNPKEFGAGALDAALIRRARACPAEQAKVALGGYKKQLVAPDQWTQGACQAAAAGAGAQDAASSPPLLPPYQCYLALRKVQPEAAGALLQKVQQGLLQTT